MQSLSDYVISSHKINKDLFSLFDVKSFKSRCSVVANMKDSFVIIEPFDNKPKSKLKRSYYKITNTSNNKGWMNYTCAYKDITEKQNLIPIVKEDIEMVSYKIEYQIPNYENTYISQLVLCRADKALFLYEDDPREYTVSMNDLISKLIDYNKDNVIYVAFIYDSFNSNSKFIIDSFINMNETLYKSINRNRSEKLYVNITKQISKEELINVKELFQNLKLSREVRILDTDRIFIKVLGDPKPTTEYSTKTITTFNEKNFTISIQTINESPEKAVVSPEIKDYNLCLVYKAKHNNWNIEIIVYNSIRKETLKQNIELFNKNEEQGWIDTSSRIILNCTMLIDNSNILELQDNINTMSKLIYSDNNIDNVMDDINHMLGKKDLSTIKRLTNQATTLSKHVYGELFPPIDWYISEKADGVHVLVYISDGKMYIIESKVYKISNTNNSSVYLFEGEVVITTNNEIILLLFDVLYMNSNKLINMNTSERIKHLDEAQKIVDNILKNKDLGRISINNSSKVDNQLIDINKVKSVRAKQWVKLTDSNLKESFEKVYNTMYSYLHDGVILMNNRHYYESTIYKWKPVEKMTIDFLVKKCPDNLLGVAPYSIKEGKTLYWLYCGITSSMYKKLQKTFPNNYISYKHGKNIDKMVKYEHYFPIPFTPSTYPLVYLYYNNRDDLDDKIIELSWDSVNNTWIFERDRLDRKLDLTKGDYYGNDYKTAELNWVNINNPLNFEDLFNYKSDNYFKETKLEKYKVQTNFNSLVKGTIIDRFCKDAKWVIDLASGKGQDLNKYSRCNIKHLTMIDIDKDAIAIGLERKFTSDRTLFDITALVTDLNEVDKSYEKIVNLRDQVPNLKDQLADVIICNFAIHYLINNISNLVKMIKSLLKKDGYFIFTTFDGSKIMDKIGKLKKGESWTVTEDNEIKYKIEKRFDESKLSTNNQKIGVLLPFSKTELYEESLVNLTYVNDIFTSNNFKKIITGSFNPDEVSKTFQVQYPSFVNELTKGDIEFISLYSYNILSNKG